MAQGNNADEPDRRLEQTGQTILQLLNDVAKVAEHNSRQAMDTAQQLSHQLEAAAQRVAELEVQLEVCREQAEHAEDWLSAVHSQIEKQFLH
jgi:hypothetical protein